MSRLILAELTCIRHLVSLFTIHFSHLTVLYCNIALQTRFPVLYGEYSTDFPFDPTSQSSLIYCIISVYQYLNIIHWSFYLNCELKQVQKIMLSKWYRVYVNIWHISIYICMCLCILYLYCRLKKSLILNEDVYFSRRS